MPNFYFLTALTRLAEDSPDDKYLKLNERVIDNLLAHKVNITGCYAMRITVDGEELDVLVDNWFVFYLDSKGVERFCFSIKK